MQSNTQILIIGAGLAGLSLSIELAKAGIAVTVIEKKDFPYHKVCGEYISNESYNYLLKLGVPLANISITHISKLQISNSNNNIVQAKLPLGGFGISRYCLDAELAKIARQVGVKLITNCTYYNYTKENEIYTIETSQGKLQASLLIAANGKYNLKNLAAIPNEKEKYIGVKYHLQLPQFNKEFINLYCFKDGYAGISGIEDNKYCFCYLVKAKYLKLYGSIPAVEKNLLYTNKQLATILSTAEALPNFPVSITNIYFGKKTVVQNDIIYLGDAAGAIPPFAGNGMSIALRSSSILAPLLIQYVNNKIDKQSLHKQYTKAWNQHFSRRINNGKLLQYLFFKPALSFIGINLFKLLKPLQSFIISKTHGKPF
jgi:menaquinone-9 beta-reductase